jgi:NADPH-dependent 2,4-dienoyl-CoA reductase/sulfur reductase-like enzyme/bacterioferritin-associated ferredoxin
MKLVLVGNGMAGIRTLEELLKAAPELYDITVFGDEPHPNYNRIMLSPVLAGEQTVEQIVLNDRDWYARHGITLHTGKRVVKIDRRKRFVEADDGTRADYDRVLLATGSRPFILPVPGADLEGVIGFRDVADVDKMIDASKRYQHAVVIGGGLLGLEAANGLKARGMDVSVVHIGDWLLERQLDEPAARLLQQSLEAKGLNFLLKKQTAELVRGESGRVRAVRFKDGEEIPADLVVMAVGIRPNTDLAESAGLHCQRGLVVNDTMQTYDPRIYAVGECVSHRGIAYGLVAPLFEQAKVCANHLAEHGVARYQGSMTSTKLKVTGIDLFSAGDFMGGAGTESLVYSDAAAGTYKKLVLKGNKLVGACIYGDTLDGAWYFDLLREGTDISQQRKTILFGQSHIGDSGHGPAERVAALPDSAEICGCNGVCKGTIVAAIRDLKLFTLDEVRAHTKASASCGSCTGLVEAVLAHTVGGNYSAAPSKKPLCKCTDHSHDEIIATIRDQKLKSMRAVFDFMEWKTPDGCPTCRPALNYYLLARWPAEVPGRCPVALHQRARPRQHPEGRQLLGGAAHVGRPDQSEGTARHRRRGRQVPGAGSEGHRRPAHRPVRGEKDGPAGHVEGSVRRRLRLRPRLRQGPAHGEDLRRFPVVPLRHPGFHRPGREAGTDDLGFLDAPQVQAGGLRLPAQLRRGDDQGLRRGVRGFRLRTARGRQRRHQGAGHRPAVPGGNRGTGDGVLRRLHPALPGRGSLPGAHRALGRAGGPGPHQGQGGGRRGGPRRPPRALQVQPAIRPDRSMEGTRRGRGGA